MSDLNGTMVVKGTSHGGLDSQRAPAKPPQPFLRSHCALKAKFNWSGVEGLGGSGCAPMVTGKSSRTTKHAGYEQKWENVRQRKPETWQRYSKAYSVGSILSGRKKERKLETCYAAYFVIFTQIRSNARGTKLVEW
ncbi:Hypothetical protein SMAX5B_014057 [Scophthalmus maximus]|uniref:Uncharacterized protein n=1 Tax=Scophthalmus maximus TaxID=52904 RepID=A0A2U9BI50_SCOMX|nr:Hypothetical protein SMAX5B_014057 [Scophthalmus maximus]